jgi:hypothetical protein
VILTGTLTDEMPWLVLVTFVFLVCFYSGTLVMSIVYPLDKTVLGF